MPHLRLRRRPSAQEAVIDLTVPTDADSADVVAAADQAQEPLDGAAADGSRVGRVLGLLTLSKHYPVELAPIPAVAAATAWALVTVLIGCLTATAAVGLIADRGVLSAAVLIATWRAAHLMPVATSDGAVTLLPMVPALVVWLLQLRACAWLWGRLRGEGGPVAGMGLAAFAGGYFLVAALIATSPTSARQAGPLNQGWAVLLLMAGSAAALIWLLKVVAPAHARVWLAIRACLTALSALLTFSFLVLMLQLLLNRAQFQGMTGQLLDSGSEPASRIDAAALGALQLAYLPNATIWVACYLLGAGFLVGQGTIVSPFSVTTGTLPDLPLVALLPSEPFPLPWLPLLCVALLSIVAGAMIRSAGLTRRLRTRVVVALGIALACATAMAVLAALASGGLGPGRLDQVGPRPGVTFVAAFFVFGFGQLIWALFPTVADDLGPFVGPLRSWAGRLHRPRLRRPSFRRPRRRRRPGRRRGRSPDGNPSEGT